MLSQSFPVLAVALLVALEANGEVNPYFACGRHSHSYDVILNRGDEIVLNNCSVSVTNEIIDLLRQSRLRGRPLRLNMIDANFTAIHRLMNVTELDLSDTKLSAIDLRDMRHLTRLNLTSNKFRSLNAVSLRDNVTLTSLDISRNRLSELKSSTIPSTRRLYVRSNNIMRLDENLTLPNSLLELDLTRNEIENISSISFSSSTLKRLNLSINLINAISNTTFSNLTALETLLLECNKIIDIEPNTFSRNDKLVELNLRDNNLFVLKKGVFSHMANLQVLDVSKNRLLRLTPDNVQNLNNLVHFSLSENTKLCHSQCKRELQFLLMLGGRLKVLRMSRLRLRYFPVTLTTSIRTLDLSANKLTTVKIGDLENFPFLEVLDLSANEIDTAEKDVFFRIEYLRELYLHDNRLDKVPGSLPPSLRHLRLDGNRIRSISSVDFHNLSKLNTLTLNSNVIEFIESDAFGSLGNLRYFDISNNPLQLLSTDAFEGVNNLETLRLSDLLDVRINTTDLRYFPISELPNLRHLNLSRSPEMVKSFLNDFPLLSTVKQLEILDFDDTGLNQTPPYLEHFLPRLKLLSMLGNPINCSDNSSLGDWKEPYRLETRRFPPNNTDFEVRITPHFIRPSSDCVTIRSRCSVDVNYTVMSKNEFWSSVLFESSTTTTPSPSLVVKRKKLSSRSLMNGGKSDFNSSAASISRDFTTSTKEATISSTPFSVAMLPTETSTYSANDTANDEYASFFDWFPSLNESAADRARIAAPDDEENNNFKNTHPGLVIFLFVSAFILVAFGSLIAPPCFQTHRWRWRYKRGSSSQLNNQNQSNIEISSISAIVETETRLD